jgi:hypothetical protein
MAGLVRVSYVLAGSGRMKHGAYMRGLPGTDDKGVSVRAAPELLPAIRAGGTFSSPSCGGAALSLDGSGRGAGADSVDIDGCADAGRGGASAPLLRARRAFSSPGRSILLIRTFLANEVDLLGRRGGGQWDVDADVSGE